MKEGGLYFYNSKSKTFLAFCFCFILGVSVFSSVFVNRKYLFFCYIFCWVLAILIIVCWRKKYLRFVLFCCLFFVAGGGRFLTAIPFDSDKHVRYYNGQQVELAGRIITEPEIGIGEVKYVIEASEISLFETYQSVKGRLLLKLPLYPQFNYGDLLSLSCELQEPAVTADSVFRYDKYLQRQGIWSICVYPKFVNRQKVYINNKGVLGNLLLIKKQIGMQIERLWPEPKSSLLAGLLYGSRSGLPSDLVDNFSKTGVTHIIAISGYNISIVANVMLGILITIGLGRRQAFWFATIGIILFVIFVGASASVVRAGVMGIIVLLAQQLGRLSRIGNVLAITAALMLLINPYVLIWDAGFQLSFLATIGLVYLSPLLEQCFGGLVTERKSLMIYLFAAIKQTLLQTGAAIIITLPLILFQFGRMSIVAPLVNILILWTIPWLMLFGFIALICSYIFIPFGQVLAWITGVGLDYVIIIVNHFGNLSWSATEFHLSLWGMALLYMVFGVVIYKYK